MGDNTPWVGSSAKAGQRVKQAEYEHSAVISLCFLTVDTV